MESKTHLSVISPVYKAEKIIPQLVQSIEENISKLSLEYEIILVEDHSPDDSWKAIKDICKENQKVIGIQLSRNFGQHNAITAGLTHAGGDWVIVMDCDLQDRPEEIPKLYKKAQEGFDIVLAKRFKRKDSFFKKLSSKLFYGIFAYLTNTRQDPSIANFGIYHKKVIEAVLKMGDYIRVFPILIQWVGFKNTSIEVKHSAREDGKSTYSWGKLLNLAFSMIFSFSEKPLIIGLKVGGMIVILSFLFGIYNLILYFQGDITRPGYASIIISIWFLSGLIIIFMGLIGLYIGKIFEKVKSRPNYIIKQQINLKK